MLNRDSHGIIAQIYPKGTFDGGDSCSWNGIYTYLTGDDPIGFTKTFEVGFGGYVRHPKPDPINDVFESYYKGPYRANISRDQHTGALAASIKNKDYLAVLRMFIHRGAWLWLTSYNTVINGKDPYKARFSLVKFFYNPKHENYFKFPDPALFDILAMEIRGMWGIRVLLWPLLVLLDVQMFFNVLLDQLGIVKQTDDVNNMLIKLFISLEYCPTPISWLTKKLVRRKNVVDRLTTYWCNWRKNCGMVRLFENKLNELGM